MGNEQITGTEKLLLCYLIYTSFLLGPLCGNDPFEGNFFAPDCIKPRPINGCPNETLLSAYKKSELSKSDKNINKAETRFYLFTPCNKNEAEFLHDCGGKLPNNTNFRPGEKTVFIVGGYLAPMCGLAIYREMKDQLLCRYEFHNVVLVDWFWGNGPDYFDARRNTDVVAKQLALVIANMMDQTGAPSTNFHIIGHSLGAHIGGCAGETLQALGKPKLRRITALDPAGPGFMNSTNCSISPDDAEYVDAIHSNAGRCLPFGLGMPVNVGHSDFYPNGGSSQWSCFVSIPEDVLKGDIYFVILKLTVLMCHHYESVVMFKNSINSCDCQFVAVRCTHDEYRKGKCKWCGPDGSKCSVMGYDSEVCQPKFGNISFFLDTDLKCPACNNKGIDLGGFSVTPPKCGERINCFEPGKKCRDHGC